MVTPENSRTQASTGEREQYKNNKYTYYGKPKKGNRSSQWRDDMECRHCTTGEHETKDNLETCIFFRNKRVGLDLTIRMHKLIFWRRVTQTLKDIQYNNKV